MDIPERVADVRRRMEAAARHSGRRPEAVRLVAVTKYRTVEEIAAAVGAGVTDIGENRVQEAEQKQARLSGPGLVWHLVGHLQSNKVKKAIHSFQWIHSIHSLELAQRVNRVAEEQGKVQSVLVQVDLAGEETKSGIGADRLRATLAQMSRLACLSVQGLMVLPPYLADREQIRPYFVRLRELRDACVREGVIGGDLPELSMGMSHDFEVAVEEGATMIRIGTALFGERPAVQPTGTRVSAGSQEEER